MKAVQEWTKAGCCWLITGCNQRKIVEKNINKGKRGVGQALPPSWECAKKIHCAPEKYLSTKEIRLKQRKAVNLNSNWGGFLFTVISWWKVYSSLSADGSNSFYHSSKGKNIKDCYTISSYQLPRDTEIIWKIQSIFRKWVICHHS